MRNPKTNNLDEIIQDEVFFGNKECIFAFFANENYESYEKRFGLLRWYKLNQVIGIIRNIWHNMIIEFIN